MGWIGRILRAGRVAEPASERPPSGAAPPAGGGGAPQGARFCAGAGTVPNRAGRRPPSVAAAPAGVRGSLQVRHVDAGSCNGCEIEISGAFGPAYDAERFGARLVAAPRHADALLVTGGG